MHKKTLSKAIAILALVGFIGLLAPGLSSAEKRGSKFDFRSIVRKPAVWISSVWSWIAPVFDLGNATVSKSPLPNNSTLKARPTGGLSAPRPGKGD
jgi:hypothetical protein